MLDSPVEMDKALPKNASKSKPRCSPGGRPIVTFTTAVLGLPLPLQPSAFHEPLAPGR